MNKVIARFGDYRCGSAEGGAGNSRVLAVLYLNIVVAELLRFKMSKSFHSKDYTIIMLLTPERQTEREKEGDRQTDRQRKKWRKRVRIRGRSFYVLFSFLFLLFYWGFVAASSTSN